MNDLDESEDIVTTNGKQFSRLMAEQIALDIELVNSIRPSAWAIGDNSALTIGNVVCLSFALPLKHGYLVDATDATGELLSAIESFGVAPHLTEQPELRRVELPEQGRRGLLRQLRAAHESAIKKNLTYFTKCQTWKWHNFEVVEQLSELTGRKLPQPGYTKELLDLRVSEMQVPVATHETGVSGLDTPLLEYIARDIEIAHEANPNCWSFYRIKSGGVVLIVEAITVTYVSNNRCGLIVLGDNDDLVFQSVDSSRVVEGYKYFPGFFIRSPSSEQFKSDVEEFQDPHRDGIVELAKLVKTRTQRASEHQPETIEALSERIGRALPSPEYVVAGAVQPITIPNHDSASSSLQGAHPQMINFSPLVAILDELAASGLNYTRDQVATFYTALQTKGFVVVSGISGTGKSKIATGFVEMLPVPATSHEVTRDTSGMIPIEVKPDMKKNRRFTIPVRYHKLLPPMEKSKSEAIAVTINRTKGTGNLWYRVGSGPNLCQLICHVNLATEIIKWTEGEHINLDVVLNSEGDKVQEICITSGRSVFESPETQAVTVPVEDSNHLFLAVRPDWRDSTSLLGYFNPLTQTYEWTDFLRFIIRAQESYRAADGLAWFVILDEMNLAHVEYYFAELLSVVESGRDLAGWTREPIRLTYPDGLDDEVPPRELKLPPNLYVIGTVNMDETTHAFSPKVLDRAFTIELSDVDFLNYDLSHGTERARIGHAEKQLLLNAFTRYDPANDTRKFAQVDKGEVAEIVALQPEIRTLLNSLNKQLQNHRFHFGYRVFDEIAQYLYNNHNNKMMEFIPAFDQAVYMKVLPKFSGSRARLRAPLLSLLAWTLDPSNPGPMQNIVQQSFSTLALDNMDSVSAFTANAVFPTVARRTMQMLVTLENDGFVSFG